MKTVAFIVGIIVVIAVIIAWSYMQGYNKGLYDMAETAHKFYQDKIKESEDTE